MRTGWGFGLVRSLGVGKKGKKRKKEIKEHILEFGKRSKIVYDIQDIIFRIHKFTILNAPVLQKLDHANKGVFGFNISP